MEHKRMLMASTSGEAEGANCTESMMDIFSNLPDQVAHHILSFLVMKDLGRFSTVSTRCRQLSLSTPSLDFDCEEADAPTCELRLKLFNSLDRYLIHRGNNKIQRFRVNWDGHNVDDDDDGVITCFCVNENFRIITWIYNAVRCMVEELDVNVTFYDDEEEPLALPSCVLLCASLRSLAVGMKRTIVKTPPFVFPSNLKILELANVTIEDGDGFFTWITCSCKFIKELSLHDVCGIKNITIEIPSLERFIFLHFQVDETYHLNISGENLEDITIECGYSPSCTILLHISPPNLRHLSLIGNVRTLLDLEELEFLKRATILMDPKVVQGFGNIYEVICSSCSVEVLVLNETVIKALFREESIQVQLDKVGYLQMDFGSFDDDLVPAMVSLLRGMPNLSTLYIFYEPTSLHPKSNYASGYDVGYWKLQNLAFIHKLEEVTLELSNGSNGVELARYILEHAENLEKIVIIYLTEQFQVIGKLLKSKPISNAMIIFQENRRFIKSEYNII